MEVTETDKFESLESLVQTQNSEGELHKHRNYAEIGKIKNKLGQPIYTSDRVRQELVFFHNDIFLSAPKITYDEIIQFCAIAPLSRKKLEMLDALSEIGAEDQEMTRRLEEVLYPEAIAFLPSPGIEIPRKSVLNRLNGTWSVEELRDRNGGIIYRRKALERIKIRQQWPGVGFLLQRLMRFLINGNLTDDKLAMVDSLSRKYHPGISPQYELVIPYFDQLIATRPLPLQKTYRKVIYQ